MRSATTITYYGDPPDVWRRRALMAQDALRVDPNDIGARRTLEGALGVIRQHADFLRETAPGDIRQYEDEARRVGRGTSAVAGAAQGATLSLGDEIAGLATAVPRLVPGGESPSTAYFRGRDEARAYNANAEVENPWTYGLAELVGGAAPTVLGGVATRAAVPFLGASATAAATPGATFGTRMAGGLARSAQYAPVAGAFGYGAGEEGPVADLGGAGLAAGAATVLGFPFGFRANDIVRENAVRAANEVRTVAGARVAQETAADRIATSAAQRRVAETTAGPRIEAAQHNAEASRFRASREEASARFYRERADQAAVQTRIAAETEPFVVQQRAAGALRAEASVSDIPLNRQMKEDRAFLLSLQRAAAEARRAGSASGASGVEARFRAHLERIGTSAEGIETAVRRARATPGSPLYSEAASAPAVPSAPRAPNTPAQAAQAAHTQVMEATGDPSQALQAARRSAAVARDAMLADVPEDASMAALRIVQGPPSVEALDRLAAYVARLSPEQRTVVGRQLPDAWKQILPDLWKRTLGL